MRELTILPSPVPLIEDWGGEEFLKIMVNANIFDYTANVNLLAKLACGDITTDEYKRSQVEFNMGFERRWVCKLEWNMINYSVRLRSLPLTKNSPYSTYGYFSSVQKIVEFILKTTNLAVCF